MRRRGSTDGSFLSYDGDDDVDDDQYEQDEWCDDDHVGEEGVDRWQLSLAGAESHPPALLLLCSASQIIPALLSISHHLCSALVSFPFHNHQLCSTSALLCLSTYKICSTETSTSNAIFRSCLLHQICVLLPCHQLHHHHCFITPSLTGN